MVRKTETNTPSPSSQVQFHSSVPRSFSSFPSSFTRGWGTAPSCHSLLLRLFPSTNMGLCQGLQFLSGACLSVLQGNTFHAMVSFGRKLQGNLRGMSSPPLTLSFLLYFFSFLSFSSLHSGVLCFFSPFLNMFSMRCHNFHYTGLSCALLLVEWS